MKPLHIPASQAPTRADRTKASSRRTSPNIINYYRSPEEPLHSYAAVPEKVPSAGSSFRSISSDYWRSENRTEFAHDVVLFAVLTLVSAWPLIDMLRALAAFGD